MYSKNTLIISGILCVAIIVVIFLLFQKRRTVEGLTTPSSSLNGYDYKGCWKDASDRALTVQIGKGYNASSCIEEGKKRGYNTVGLQYTDGQCWAGNQGTGKDDYKKYGEQTDKNQCDANKPGAWTNIVYGAAAPAVVPELPVNDINGYEYKGCWKDADDRALTVKIGDGYNTTSCVEEGKKQGYDTVGLQYSNGQCWAGNQGNGKDDYKKYGEQTDPTQCYANSPGAWTNLVYQLKQIISPSTSSSSTTSSSQPPVQNIDGYEYKGCWKDADDRALDIKIGDGYTLETCVSAAKIKGYDTIGLQYGGQCWAGNQGSKKSSGIGTTDYTRYGKQTDEGQCDINNPGAWTNIIYSKPSSATVAVAVDSSSTQTSSSVFTPTPTPTPSPTSSSSPQDTIIKLKEQNKNMIPALANGRPNLWSSLPTLKDTSLSKTATVSGSGSSLITDSSTSKISTQSTTASPTYTTPNTTTISFEPSGSSTTVITFTQSPSLSYVKSLMGSTIADTSAKQPSTTLGSGNSSSSSSSDFNSAIGSSTTQPYTFISNSSEVMNPNLLNAYGSSSRNNISNVYPNLSNYSQMNPSTAALFQTGPKWNSTGTTPFYYESGNNTSTTSTQSATATSNLMESFMNSFFSNNSRGSKEGLETLSPPPSDPHNFMPKSEAVPPVCPSIPPVIIKQKCDPCPACAPCKNSPYGLPPPNSQGVSYDNLPMPNLPSFKGFGL